MAGLLKPASQKSKIRRLGNQPTDNPGRNPSTRPSATPATWEPGARERLHTPFRPPQPPPGLETLVKLNQLMNTTAAGALAGALWGTVVGIAALPGSLRHPVSGRDPQEGDDDDRDS